MVFVSLLRFFIFLFVFFLAVIIVYCPFPVVFFLDVIIVYCLGFFSCSARFSWHFGHCLVFWIVGLLVERDLLR